MNEERTSSRKTRVGKSFPTRWIRPWLSPSPTAWPIPVQEDRRPHLQAEGPMRENACGIGDTVKVMETRPLSKDKRWRVVEIIEKAK